MEKTVFPKICDHEIPAEIVYEDDQFVAFMDIHPNDVGHVLVVSRQPYRWVWDHPTIGEYFTVVQKLAHAQQRAFGVDMIRSSVYGNEVHHAHVHLWPHEAAGDKHEISVNAQKIRDALAIM